MSSLDRENVKTELFYLADKISTSLDDLYRDLEDSESVSLEDWKNLSERLTDAQMKISDILAQIHLI